MKKNLFTASNIMAIIMMIVMMVSGASLLHNEMESRQQKIEQEEVAKLATESIEEISKEIPEETKAEEDDSYVSPINFEALQAKNEDVVGWISIPDTNIDYPILHDAEDNEKYLHTDFEGKENQYGAIYLDSDSEQDFSSWNNPIYGHHMKDGSMFKDIVKFKDEQFFKTHQFFEIYTPERTIHLKAVSCYYTDANGIARKTQFESQKTFDAWVQDRLEPCTYAEIPGESVKSIFTFVTCSYEKQNARTLLFAVEVDENGNVISAEKNV